jgi:hypothetical protein
MEDLPAMLKDLKKMIPAGFTNPSGMANMLKNFMLFAKISVIFLIMIMILQAVSSAKLSYSYNLSIGNSHVVALLYAILCFVFPYFYFPYYAFFLFSASAGGSASNRMIGGSLRRR